MFVKHRSPRQRAFSSSRRAFLRNGASGVLCLGVIGGETVRASVARAECGAGGFGPLEPPDANGLRLPPGFSSRIVAVSTQPPVATSSYSWPLFPDGGATFATGDGGWIYVANSEVGGTGGGVAALRFASDGTLLDAYPILTGTARNCAGGPTPWGSWLSCEEIPAGRVWECDPLTPFSQGVVRPALGSFNHEACAVDPLHHAVYLTEDALNGRLYRFTPDSYPDLGAGILETAEILDPLGQGPIQPGQERPLAWHAVAAASPVGGGAVDASRLARMAPALLSDPSQDPILFAQDPEHLPLAKRATRYQVAAATPFARGEGCWFEAGTVYFATTADNRVWALDTAAQTIWIVYDLATSSTPELSGADNVYAAPTGDVFVAEDGGNMQLVALTPSGGVKPIIQVMGQSASEITGPALSPDGSRLYFSSQQGPTPMGNLGVSYEVRGPFIEGCTAVPALGNLGTLLLGSALGAAMLWSLRRRNATESA